MPVSVITHAIENYRIKLCSRDADWDASYRYRAVISCYNAGNVVGYLYFKQSVGNYDDTYYTTRDGVDVVKLLFEDRDFDRILSLLQNESPVYINLRKTYEGREGIGYLTTSDEPVGEEEG